MGVVFVGGNLALDFVGTLNERWSKRVENLRAPEDLASWLVQAGVLDAGPAVSAEEFDAALAVREALFGLVRALIDGRPLAARDLAVVNAAAAVSPPSVRVTGGGHRRRTGDLAAALSAVARDGIALFDRDDDAVVKWCADDSCTHPFLDRSRGHRRRWCDMAACGARAKTNAFRGRQRAVQA